MGRWKHYLVFACLAAVVASVAGAVWGFRLFPDSRSVAPPTPASSATPVEAAVACFGYVDPPQGLVSLSPSQPGRVTAIEVHEGQHVKAGQVLLRLDDDLASLRVAEAANALLAAQKQLEKVRKLPQRHDLQANQQLAALEAGRSRLASARHLLARKRQLQKGGMLSPEEVEAAVETVKELEALVRAEEAKLAELRLTDPATEVARAEAEVAVLQARLDQARLAVEQCQLKAPAGGTVLRILAHEGEVLTGPPQRAVVFAPGGPPLIRASVEQEFAGQLRTGLDAVVQDVFRGGKTWPGKVTSVDTWYGEKRLLWREPHQFTDVRTLECVITLDPEHFDPSKPDLRIGQRVRVLIGGKPLAGGSPN